MSIIKFITTIICVFISINSLASETSIDGFDGYKFGMTLEQASSVRNDDRLYECNYVSSKWCLQHKTKFYGETAEVNALLDDSTKKVYRVNVIFNRIERTDPSACKSVVNTLLPLLVKKYGDDNYKIQKETRSITWYLPAGGSVMLSNICMNDGVGVVSISYEPSNTL